MTTQGRAPRKTYWTVLAASLFTFAIMGGLLNISYLASVLNNLSSNVVGVSEILLASALIFIGFTITIVSVCTTIRRLHDLNMRGWWLLLNLIPYIGSFAVLVMCGFLKGTEGENKYGPQVYH